jgi:hypothetical protein
MPAAQSDRLLRFGSRSLELDFTCFRRELLPASSSGQPFLTIIGNSATKFTQGMDFSPERPA